MPTDTTPNAINVQIDLQKILSNTATQLEIDLFNSFLHANENSANPQSLFNATNVVYFSDTLPDMSQPSNNQYKNSYVFTNDDRLSLKYIDPQGKISNIELNEFIKESIKKQLDQFKNIDPTLPLFSQLDNNRRAIEAIAPVIPGGIRPNSYPVTLNGKNYAVEFKQNIVRRQSKRDPINNLQKYHYEILNSVPFYVANLGIRNLYFSLGTAKTQTTKQAFFFTKNSFIPSTKHRRVVKLEAVEDEDPSAVHQERMEQYQFLKNLPAGIGLKAPELIEIPRVGYVIANTMAYIEGQGLDKVIKSPDFKSNRLNEIEQMLSEVYINFHHLGWLHRDIKLSNFMLNNDKIQIIDFDDAISEKKAASAKLAGTENFFAPELKETSKNTMASDVFALGIAVLSRYLGKEVEASNVNAALEEMTNGDFKALLASMTNSNPDLRSSTEEAFMKYIEIKPALEEEQKLEMQAKGSMSNIMSKLEIILDYEPTKHANASPPKTAEPLSSPKTPKVETLNEKTSDPAPVPASSPTFKR